MFKDGKFSKFFRDCKGLKVERKWTIFSRNKTPRPKYLQDCR